MGVSPRRLRTLGLYGGAQGIWVDKIRTAPLTADGVGVMQYPRTFYTDSNGLICKIKFPYPTCDT
jgi:hypothetical protein